jgi:hypothetical protein
MVFKSALVWQTLMLTSQRTLVDFEGLGGIAGKFQKFKRTVAADLHGCAGFGKRFSTVATSGLHIGYDLASVRRIRSLPLNH